MGKFILSATGNKYQLEFVAANGERLFRQSPFLTKSDVQSTIRTIREAAPRAHHYVKRESQSQYFFELWDNRNEVLITSIKYWSAQSRDYGMMILKREAEAANFLDHT